MINSSADEVFNGCDHEWSFSKSQSSIDFGVSMPMNRYPVVAHDGHYLNIFAVCRDVHHHDGVSTATTYFGNVGTDFPPDVRTKQQDVLRTIGGRLPFRNRRT